MMVRRAHHKMGWMGAMTVFVVMFYSLLYASTLLPSHREMAAEQKVEQAETLKELRQKEAVVKQKIQEDPGLIEGFSVIFALVFLAGLFLNGWLGLRRFQRLPWPVPSLPRAPAAWTARDVLDGFIFLLFAEACLFMLQNLVVYFIGASKGAADCLLLLSSLIRGLLVAVFVWSVARGRYGQGLSEFGVRFEKGWVHLRTGFLGYLAVVPPLLLLFFLLALVLQFFSWEPQPQNVVQMYLEDSTPYLIPLTFFVAIVGPLLEEFFFRGFAYAGLRKRFGVKGGAALSALAFAALHMNLTASVPIFFLGFVLALLYEVSGSLVAPVTLHMMHNMLMVILTLGFKGLSS